MKNRAKWSLASFGKHEDLIDATKLAFTEGHFAEAGPNNKNGITGRYMAVGITKLGVL